MHVHSGTNLPAQMKIYTRTGDTGETGLFGGPRVSKDARRINAYGTVDELNATLGLVASGLQQTDALQEVRSRLRRVQNELFVLGADLATPLDASIDLSRIDDRHVDMLEEEIDEMDKALPPLERFILPGGSETAARLHLARTVARRAERELVAFGKDAPYNVTALRYLNRLSDWLFVLARWTNKQCDVPEVEWQS